MNYKIFEKISSGANVFIHTAACNPMALVELFCDYIVEKKLYNINFYHLHLEGQAVHLEDRYREHVMTNCFFIGKNSRQALSENRVSYIPIFLSEIGRLFSDKIIDLDLALIQLSSFDKRGLATLGPSVDVTIDAIDNAKYVVAMVNKNLPKVHGSGVLKMEEIDEYIEIDAPMLTTSLPEVSSIHQKIGKHVANLIDNGSTLQMGIGAIPNAILSYLESHQDLGIHTEMLSDGIIPLIEKGVITNRKKKVHPHKVIASFAVGTQKLYDYLDDNPLMHFMSASFINDPRVIMKNPKVCAINSAIEIDLSGQVCADSIGHNIYSGVGGQVDFIRGSYLSHGGKPIIAMTSRTNRGTPKIVSCLKAGAGVVTSRAHVDYVVTEYGAISLRGKNLKERAKSLISIAHPEDREELERLCHYIK